MFVKDFFEKVYFEKSQQTTEALELTNPACKEQNFSLSLSHKEHGWAHAFNTIYSVIHGLTGSSIELQPCLGMGWYDRDSNVA